jgi:hypothetical protein
MAYEQRDFSGTLFRNERKEKDNHPDYNGTALIDGVEYWMNAWIKTGVAGKKTFMSFSFQKKEEEARAGGPSRGAATSKQNVPDDDDIPF